MIGDLVSIIIPVYNAKSTLVRCLDSVLQQTYYNIEVILVNDGSTDSSGEICDKYKARDARIRVIHKTNSGVSSTRNMGLNIASGTWIGFVDSDDWVEPDMFEKLLYAAMKSGSKIIVCGHKDYRGDVAKKRTLESSGLMGQMQAIEHLLSYDSFEGYLWNKLFNKNLLVNIRLDKDIHFCEDILFCIKVFVREKEIYYLSDTLYHHCLSEHSAMLNFNSKRLTELLAWERTASVLEMLSPKLEKIAKCRYADAAIAQYYYIGYQFEDSGLKQKLKKASQRYFAIYITSSATPIGMRVKSAIKFMFPQLERVVSYCKQKKSV